MFPSRIEFGLVEDTTKPNSIFQVNFHNNCFPNSLRRLQPTRPFFTGCPEDETTPNLSPVSFDADGKEVDHAAIS